MKKEVELMDLSSSAQENGHLKIKALVKCSDSKIRAVEYSYPRYDGGVLLYII